MFDLAALQAAIAAHGRVARIVIAAMKGSSPRGVGTAMLVWEQGQSGTIGGGALEFQATTRARALLTKGGTRLDHEPLGPSLGQCCGGAVTLLTEVYTRTTLPTDLSVIARPITASAMPLSVKRLLDQARAQGRLPEPQLVDGWMVEPMARPSRNLWVWGAGHVGRALVATLAPLPDFAITWVDVDSARYPATIPEGVSQLPARDPAMLVRHAPVFAEHLILTYSHALDLDLCHRLLLHGFARAGLIGSATKWSRFRSRLSALGHTPAGIARITCPIGNPALGKHPQAIAIGVAAQMLAFPASARKEQAQ